MTLRLGWGHRPVRKVARSDRNPLMRKCEREFPGDAAVRPRCSRPDHIELTLCARDGDVQDVRCGCSPTSRASPSRARSPEHKQYCVGFTALGGVNRTYAVSERGVRVEAE